MKIIRLGCIVFAAVVFLSACRAGTMTSVGQSPAQTGTISAEPAPTFESVTAYRLNVRERPSGQSSVVTVLKKNESVEVLSQDGNWIQVKTLEGIYGWVYGAYLTGFEQTIGLPEQEQTAEGKKNKSKSTSGQKQKEELTPEKSIEGTQEQKAHKSASASGTAAQSSEQEENPWKTAGQPEETSKEPLASSSEGQASGVGDLIQSETAQTAQSLDHQDLDSQNLDASVSDALPAESSQDLDAQETVQEPVSDAVVTQDFSDSEVSDAQGSLDRVSDLDSTTVSDMDVTDAAHDTFPRTITVTDPQGNEVLIYSGAFLDASILMRVDSGTEFEAKGVEDGWYEIVTQEGVGYVPELNVNIQ